ncbi:MAG: serine acetyltransferase [Polyangiaceae bacterium]
MRKTLDLILSDLRRKAEWCYERTDRGAMMKALATDGTPAMILYRLMQSSRAHGLAPLEMVFNRLNTSLCGCTIGRGAEFGPGFVLIHSDGVVINGLVRGGSNILVEHQVTIGAERRQAPELGNDIFIGAGAKIIGTAKVGDGAKIGANAVVVRDVAANTTVVGVPAKPVVRREASPAEPAAEDAGQPKNEPPN